MDRGDHAACRPQVQSGECLGAPLIIGSAAEYGVNIVLRALESSAQGGSWLARSTVMGVVFNGLTTMAGFGSLLVAHHRGVWSPAVLLVIGSAMTLTALSWCCPRSCTSAPTSRDPRRRTRTPPVPPCPRWWSRAAVTVRSGPHITVRRRRRRGGNPVDEMGTLLERAAVGRGARGLSEGGDAWFTAGRPSSRKIRTGAI
jgi:hypothetical protein